MIDYQIVDPNLIITASGEWTNSIAGSTQAEASRLVTENNLSGILVDLREAAIKTSTFEIYEGTASHLSKFPIQTRHAIVVANNKKAIKDVQFFENVAINRGMPAKYFTDYDEAIKWLLS